MALIIDKLYKYDQGVITEHRVIKVTKTRIEIEPPDEYHKKSIPKNYFNRYYFYSEEEARIGYFKRQLLSACYSIVNGISNIGEIINEIDKLNISRHRLWH
ncbi:hypothetical protein [Immundisolibacter sp.]